MKAIFYLVNGEDSHTGSTAFPTQKLATDHAKDVAEDGEDATVVRVTTADLGVRELMVAVYNRQDFAAEYDALVTYPGKRKVNYEEEDEIHG